MIILNMVDVVNSENDTSFSQVRVVLVGQEFNLQSCSLVLRSTNVAVVIPFITFVDVSRMGSSICAGCGFSNVLPFSRCFSALRGGKNEKDEIRQDKSIHDDKTQIPPTVARKEERLSLSYTDDITRILIQY